jgi:uncharacterized damage-inducible protein DinB
MANEAWQSGKLAGFSDLVMPSAHALVQAITELQQFTDLTEKELLARPNGTASIVFHLRHIAGSSDRLLTYTKGETLSEMQFEFLRQETAETVDLNAKELVSQTISAIETVLDFCKTVPIESLFEKRFIGRKKLPTNVFGLLFHIAEHTGRHVGQIITMAKIVRK